MIINTVPATLNRRCIMEEKPGTLRFLMDTPKGYGKKPLLKHL